MAWMTCEAMHGRPYGGESERREVEMYDKLVGAGTYVFQLDADRRVDATRAGNMARPTGGTTPPTLCSHEPSPRVGLSIHPEGASCGHVRSRFETCSACGERPWCAAHLANHSCDPNSHSRLITANGDVHIILFATRVGPAT